MKLFPKAGDGAIFTRWWFWVGLVVLAALAAYAVRYTSWTAQYMSDHAEDAARGAAAQIFDYQQKQLEQQYRNDTYGGDTPEETLKLFVEALEKKDFALAAKYYVPEKQVKALQKLRTGNPVALNLFITAYKEGATKATKLGSSGSFEVDVVGKDSPTPFIFEVIQNSFTNKWKITEPS